MKIGYLARPLQSAWTSFNERYLNISTMDRSGPADRSTPPTWAALATERARHHDSVAYAPADYFYIRKILSTLRLTEQDVIYDIGCGMGRFLCVASRQRVKKCVGIELLDELCAIARDNADRVRGRRSPVVILNQDATDADVSDGTVYFLYNPFGERTLKEVLANIRQSLIRQPRRLRIVYYHSHYLEAFATGNWLRSYCSYRTILGRQIHFFETTAP